MHKDFNLYFLTIALFSLFQVVRVYDGWILGDFYMTHHPFLLCAGWAVIKVENLNPKSEPTYFSPVLARWCPKGPNNDSPQKL